MRHNTRHPSFDLFGAFGNYAPGWSGILLLAVLFLVGGIVGSALMLLLQATLPAQIADTYGMIIVYPIQFLPAMLFAASKSRARENIFGEGPAAIPLNRTNGTFWTWIAVAVTTISCAIVVEPVMLLLPEMPAALKNAMELLAGGPLWVALLSTAVFAPFFEEWLCRGMVLRGLLEHTSPAVAITVSAAFFAIIHLNPWQAIPAFILGCLFGLVYYKTRSLVLTMIMHCANNAFSVISSKMVEGTGEEYFYQIIGDRVLYGCIYACCAALLVYFVVKLSKAETASYTFSQEKE